MEAMIKKYPHLNLEKICSIPVLYEVSYKEHSDDTTIQAVEFNPIEIDVTGQNITPKDVNQ